MSWTQLNWFDLNLIVIGSVWIYPCIMLIKMKYILKFYGGGSFWPPFVHVDKRGGVWKMSTLVHSRGGGGQNWLKFGPRSCWMPPKPRNSFFFLLIFQPITTQLCRLKCLITRSIDTIIWWSILRILNRKMT